MRYWYKNTKKRAYLLKEVPKSLVHCFNALEEKYKFMLKYKEAEFKSCPFCIYYDNCEYCIWNYYFIENPEEFDYVRNNGELYHSGIVVCFSWKPYKEVNYGYLINGGKEFIKKCLARIKKMRELAEREGLR